MYIVFWTLSMAAVPVEICYFWKDILLPARNFVFFPWLFYFVLIVKRMDFETTYRAALWEILNATFQKINNFTIFYKDCKGFPTYYHLLSTTFQIYRYLSTEFLSIVFKIIEIICFCFVLFCLFFVCFFLCFFHLILVPGNTIVI